MAEGAVVEKRIRLSAEQVERLRALVEARQESEDLIVGRALDILFSLADVLDGGAEQRAWSLLLEESFRRVWDNDEAARYDDWKELYGIPAR